MKPILLDKSTGVSKRAVILKADLKGMPLRKDGWQFTWRSLAKTEGATFYKIVLKETSNIIEGIIMLTLMHGEMLYLNNIEVAPHNYGNRGKYEHVAGCLLAFACRESIAKGKGNYKGFLVLDSKTELIELYETKYGATRSLGHTMFIDPEAGFLLMENYLNISTDL